MAGEAGHADRLDRLEEAVARRSLRVRWVNVPLLVVRAGRRIVDVRVTGLAAEMTYYAVISLLPLVTTLGAALGFLERFVGTEQIRAIEATLVGALGRVFDEELTGDFLLPLVEGLLREERGAVAIGGLLVSLWLAGRMFRAAIRALDDAYTVSDRRGLLAQWGLGVGLSIGAVLILTAILAMVVIGPLLGGGQALAEWLGLERAFQLAWALVRWPVIGALGVGFLTVLYRFGPNVDNAWRDCLPGAVVGTLGLVGVAIGFQAYLATAGPAVPQVGEAGAAVIVAAQTLGAALAAVLWLWLSSIAMLVGGVVNAELQRMRSDAVAAP